LRSALLSSFTRCASLLFLTAAGHAGDRSLADYPLRVHIFQVTQRSHYYRESMDFADGEGRANLFENGEARGFDFNFRCGTRLMTSPGYETYAARWKKPGKELALLLPVMGRPGSASSCELKVELKPGAYYRHNGALEEEPTSAFKQWMEKHQYDPEHGKNEPVNLTPSTAPTPGTSTGPH
jgi:hypothetical protein